MDDIKRALESIYAIQNQQQATEESVGNIGEAPSGAQSAQVNLDKDVELQGSFNAKTFGALLGMDSSEASLLASFLAKHKNGMQPSRNELLAAADVFRALIDAETQVTTQALSMLRRIHADTAEGAYESVEDEIAQVVDESIRITKEGVEECWGDMAAPAAPAQAGETMTVNISMPNKNISVTTDSVDEIMNVLKLAGIAVGTTEPAVAEPEAPAADAEPAMVGAPVAPVADTPTGIAGDVDGDGDHDKADHDAEEPADDEEEKDDKAIMGAKESAKPDYNDVDKDGNEKESWEDAEKDKQNESLSQHDEINYRLNANREPTQQELDLPGVQYDPDTGKIAVKNATSLANTHRALQKAGWEQYTRNKGQAGAGHAGDSAYQLENQRILQLAGVNESETLSEGLIDMLKAKVLPKVTQLLGAELEGIAKKIKIITGDDLSLTKDNAIKVAKAFGFDKLVDQQTAPQEAEFAVAGNWQGKLIQLLYAAGIGASGAGMALGGGTLVVLGAIGFILLMGAQAVFGGHRGQVGAMGNYGNQGTSMKKGPGAMDAMESDRILQLAGLGETKLANSPACTSMDEPTEFDSLPSEKGTGAGKPDYGTRQSNMGGENPMALHSLDMEESFQQAMGEYRKFVAENISNKK